MYIPTDKTIAFLGLHKQYDAEQHLYYCSNHPDIDKSDRCLIYDPNTGKLALNKLVQIENDGEHTAEELIEMARGQDLQCVFFGWPDDEGALLHIVRQTKWNQ